MIRVQNRPILILQHLRAEGLDVELHGGLHITQSLLISVALADDHAPHAHRLGHSAVGVLFDDDFEIPHGFKVLAGSWSGKMHLRMAGYGAQH